LSPAERAAHERELTAHFNGPPHAHDYFVMGRYLLGLTDEVTVLRLAVTPQRRCEIAYYIGLKAMTEKHLTEASGWFRIACETGQSGNLEYAWAKDNLYRWAGSGRSLSKQPDVVLR
ncbi:MAG: hypothetical protein ACRD3J_04275, partial [Thermoanaerobaculia bacterium]